MGQIEEALDLAIQTTVQSFLRHPANFSEERSLAEDVRSRIYSVLKPASVESVDVREPSGAAGAIPDHERYTARYRETTDRGIRPRMSLVCVPDMFGLSP